MRVCEWFDLYRDEELSAEEREQFKAHLAGCPECSPRMALLDNLVCVLKLHPSEAPPGLAERIARSAFAPRTSWDALVVSWLRPVPALITLAVTILLFSALWLTPGFRLADRTSVGEYEALVDESYGLGGSGSVGQVRSDDDFANWLEQEGGAR